MQDYPFLQFHKNSLILLGDAKNVYDIMLCFLNELCRSRDNKVCGFIGKINNGDDSSGANAALRKAFRMCF